MNATNNEPITPQIIPNIRTNINSWSIQFTYYPLYRYEALDKKLVWFTPSCSLISLSIRMATVAARTAFQRLLAVNVTALTSIAYRTPPRGAPKVHVTPTATAAVRN